MISFIARIWHKSLMKYHYSQFESCNDPQLKEQFYEKASFHAKKILQN